jgi:hypothetical protein
MYQVTQFHGGNKNGERCSAAAAYLHPVMDRPNLTVITKARATKILFEGKRAVGVAYRQDKTSKTVRANKEIILAAAAFNLRNCCSYPVLGALMTSRHMVLRWCMNWWALGKICRTIWISHLAKKPVIPTISASD